MAEKIYENWNTEEAVKSRRVFSKSQGKAQKMALDSSQNWCQTPLHLTHQKGRRL